ncbi:dynein assembly factor 4, axonemal [Thalassophryne amazonica]|uniref:dynein assembly factor 4, axonemal n=1 Tax=Thalassophryne amazonica TaxID=390379 RepID=UPI001471EF21|nr:dynein assembly factor 4, axonemal [Thalassophryne amazonica]
MPLAITDYSWTQTESMLYINVPLKGTKADKIDIVSTDDYLKIHFPPYLFEAFLFEPVDEDKSTARIGKGVAVISLPKRAEKLWDHLMIPADDKEKLKSIRERALLKYQEKLINEAKVKTLKKHAEKKYALETMMKLEEEERASIQKIRNAEREKATAELEMWKLKQKRQVKEDTQLKLHRQRQRQEKPTDQRYSSEAQSKMKEVPAPRVYGTIQVSFTPRHFPTALRESRVPEEEEWLRKQAEARHAAEADSEELKDLNEQEKNPDWLKEKGDKYFAVGNYLAAVNAYNLAIKLNRNIPAFYSNRAACHLKLRNLHKAIEDSSQALDLLTPPVPTNAAARARVHVRRGAAFCQLQLYTEGLQDYQAALELDPDNEGLQKDTQRIRAVIQGTVPELT